MANIPASLSSNASLVLLEWKTVAPPDIAPSPDPLGLINKMDRIAPSAKTKSKLIIITALVVIISSLSVHIILNCNFISIETKRIFSLYPLLLQLQGENVPQEI